MKPDSTCMRRAMPALLLLAACAAPAWAHGDKAHAPKSAAPISAEQHPWGRQGDPARARRTVRVDMADTMRYTPDRLQIRRGETVTFEVHNRGRVMHEFVIGTREELQRHAELMKRFPDMEHDAPYMAHVKPGARERITWQFTEAGSFLAGCLIPGHWEAGMQATLTVKE